MRRDPAVLRMLRDATRDATQNLDNLKIVRPEHNPGVAALRNELRIFLAKNQKWVANGARSLSRQAKESSARHRRELMQIKQAAEEASKRMAAKTHPDGTSKKNARRGKAQS